MDLDKGIKHTAGPGGAKQGFEYNPLGLSQQPEPVHVPAPVQMVVPPINIPAPKLETTQSFDFDFAASDKKEEVFNSDTKVSDPFATNRELEGALSGFNMQDNNTEAN